MKTDKELSKRIIKKIVCACIILICLFTVGVKAARSDFESVTIAFSDNT